MRSGMYHISQEMERMKQQQRQKEEDMTNNNTTEDMSTMNDSIIIDNEDESSTTTNNNDQESSSSSSSLQQNTTTNTTNSSNNSTRWIVSATAPGKLILFGEHAVVHGEPAVAASLSDLRIHVQIKCFTKSPNIVFMELPDIEESSSRQYAISIMELKELTLHQPPTKQDLSNLKKLLLNHMTMPTVQSSIVSILYLLHQIILTTTTTTEYGYHVQVKSHGLPSGAGLGSSAAFSVACSAAFYKLSLLLQSSSSLEQQPQEQQPTKEQLETINNLAYYSEILLHGTPSGIDNTVSTFGGAIYYNTSQKSSKNMEPITFSKNQQLHMILTNTNVPRSTKALVAHVHDRKQQHPHIITPMLQSIGAIAKTFRDMVVADGGEKEGENKNNSWNLETIGDLIRMNQSLLYCLGVSHDSIEELVHSVFQEYPTKLTGAGGGGCVFTMVESLEQKGKLQQQLQSEDEQNKKKKQKKTTTSTDNTSSKKWNWTFLSSTVGGPGVQWTTSYPPSPPLNKTT